MRRGMGDCFGSRGGKLVLVAPVFRGSVAVLLACAAGCADEAIDPIDTVDCSGLPEPYYMAGYEPDMDLSAMIPGYAGTFLTPDGDADPGHAIQVNLTDPLQGYLHESELRDYLVDWVGTEWSGELVFAQVDYGYLELLEWKAFFFDAPWNALGIDIIDNAVEITVSGEAGAAEILRIAACRSVPPDAVVIEYGEVGQD